jgi:hypothetical protein
MGELGTMVCGQLTSQAAADPAETFLDGYLGHPEVGQVAVADRGDVPGTRAAANGPGHKLGQRKLDLVSPCRAGAPLTERLAARVPSPCLTRRSATMMASPRS